MYVIFFGFCRGACQKKFGHHWSSVLLTTENTMKTWEEIMTELKIKMQNACMYYLCTYKFVIPIWYISNIDTYIVSEVWVVKQVKVHCYLWAKGSSVAFWHRYVVLCVHLSLVTFGDLFLLHCGLLLFWTVLTLRGNIGHTHIQGHTRLIHMI